MRKNWLAGFVAVITVAYGTSAVAEIYTISSDSGTYDSPVPIESLSVTSGTSGTMTFDAMLQTFAVGDVLVKKGAGFVSSSTKMGVLTGATSEIRIDEGAFVIFGANQLGVQDLDNAPRVTVAAGATLLLSGDQKFGVYNRFVFAGNGVDAGAQGKLGAFCANSSVSQNDSFFFNTVSLADDTEFFNKSGNRLDFYDGRERMNLNGHTLKLRGRGTMCWSGVYVAPGMNGKIITEVSMFQIQGGDSSKVWDGDASNELIFGGSANYAVYNSGIRIPWSVVWDTDGWIYNISSSSFQDQWGKRTVNCFDGPVRIAAKVMSFTDSEKSYPKGFALNGPVSGPGGIYTGQMLHLFDNGNTFGGPVAAVAKEANDGTFPAAGVYLYNPGALPMNDQPLALTNALVRMSDDQVFHLRPVEAHVTSDMVQNNYIAGGAEGGTIVSLKKTGSAAFEYQTPMNVTGKVELIEGVLRMPPVRRQYSLVPGLWTGKFSTNDAHVVFATKGEANNWVQGYMSGVSPLFSNKVDSCTAMLYGPSAYPPWEEYEVVTWSGYIWNRSPTNEVWTFAVRMSGYAYMWVNGSIYMADDTSNIVLHNVHMNPGANSFVYKCSPRSYRPVGAAPLPATGRSTAWPDGWGLSVDRLGRNTADIAYFEKLLNGIDTRIEGGDGLVFTRDARNETDFDQDDLIDAARGDCRRMECLVARAGTVLDLGNGNAMPYPLPSLEGFTTVSNGGLTVSAEWTLPISQVGAGGTLSVDGKLSFGADAKIIIREDVRPTQKGEFVVAEAKDEIIMPEGWHDGEMLGDDLKRRYVLRRSDDGKQLILGVFPRGFCLILR